MAGRWTDEQWQTAQTMHAAGHSYKFIAKKIGRPWKSIENKLIWERLSPEERADRLQAAYLRRGDRRVLSRQARTIAPAAYRGQQWHGRCTAFRPRYAED